MKNLIFLLLIALGTANYSCTRESEWITIFDGETFNGWRGYNRSDVPSRWSVEDGILKLDSAIKGVSTKSEGGDLIFDEKLGNFELELEWNIAKGGNSGIFYLGREVEGMLMSRSAPEYQLLDNSNNSDATKGVDNNHQSGSLYDMIPAIPQNQNPYGEWNKARIVVSDGNVAHYQNDVKVLEYTLWSEEWNEMIGSSKFNKKDQPKAYDLLINCGGEERKGYIGLQDHGYAISFRNIRIKKL